MDSNLGGTFWHDFPNSSSKDWKLIRASGRGRETAKAGRSEPFYACEGDHSSSKTNKKGRVHGRVGWATHLGDIQIWASPYVLPLVRVAWAWPKALCTILWVDKEWRKGDMPIWRLVEVHRRPSLITIKEGVNTYRLKPRRWRNW